MTADDDGQELFDAACNEFDAQEAFNLSLLSHYAVCIEGECDTERILPFLLDEVVEASYLEKP